ncbi:MAG: phosphotransferase [Rickettsiales bacterium]|jgi:serine/threonine protein kinase|nr:phosphotransferase [Rickettsiales bacterium]
MKYIVPAKRISNASESTQELPLRDAHGNEYLAVAPRGYKILGFFNRGGECFATEVVHEKSRQHRILKNYIEKTQWTWCNVVEVEGMLLDPFVRRTPVSVPKIYDAGMECGRYNYVIEEKRYGVRLTEEVLASLPKKKKIAVIDCLADFLYSLHNMKQAKDRHVLLRKFSSSPGNMGKYEALAPLARAFPRGAPATVVHGDFFPKNILFNELKGGEIAISAIDWGGSAESDISYDFISMAGKAEVREIEGRNPNEIDFEYFTSKTVELIAKAYVRAGGGR